MKVFISWSGSAERVVAEALRTAVSLVSAGRASGFVSSQDIPKGDRGASVIDASLVSTDYGIVILSANNQHRPWINYEGGALAKTLDHPVATILLDLLPSDVEGPLQPFQSTAFANEGDMRSLMRQIAKAADPSISDEVIDVLFDSTWPDLSRAWNPSVLSGKDVPRRTDSDMLAEIVDRVRRLETLPNRSRRHQGVQDYELASKGRVEIAAVRALDEPLKEVFSDILRRVADERVAIRRVEKDSNQRVIVGLDMVAGTKEEELAAVMEALQKVSNADGPLSFEVVVVAAPEGSQFER